MTRLARFTIVTAASLLTILGVSLAQAATLNRLAAQFRKFNGTEDSSIVTPTSGTPTTIYSKLVFAPADGVLYVAINATGDSHKGTAHLLPCQVNGINCTPGPTFSGSPFTGWINLQRVGATEDFHDNGIAYQWCAPVSAGFQFVTLKLASLLAATAVPGAAVFLEGENFTIDFEESPHCTLGSP